MIKVSRHFHEVPPSQLSCLQQRLLQLLSSYLEQRGPKIVLTRLCVAVAHLVIHGASSGLWQNPVEELINIFHAEMEKRGVAVLGLLLELLTIIPEEFATSVLATSKRALVRAEMTKSLPLVVDILRKVFNEQELASEITVQTMKGLQAWVQFEIPNEVTEEIFSRLISYLSDEELYDASLDAMGAIISHPNSHKFPMTMRRLLSRVVELDMVFYKLMAEENFDTALPLASFFITFGESQSRMILDWAIESQDGQLAAIRLVNVILNVSLCNAQYPTQETLSEMPFGFWYIFQDDIIACEPQQFQICAAVFGPVYLKLVEGLLKKCMYQADDSVWSLDQKEMFRCYRTDIGDTIMYCYSILRENLLNLLLAHLDAAVSKANEDHAVNWPYLEACLFAWSSIGESLAEEEECPQLAQFLSKLITIPYHDNIKVITSAMDCIGSFSELLYNYPNILSHILPIITSAIRNPELALCSTMALKDLSRDCADVMGPFAQSILTQCQQLLSSNELKNGECIRLMYPIGKMLSQIPQGQIMPYLESILTPHLMALQEMSSQETTAGAKPRLVFIFKLLTSLFQSMEIAKGQEHPQAGGAQIQSRSQPLVILYPQLMPYIKSISFKWAHDTDVMDALWTFVKQVTTCLEEFIKPFTHETVDLIIQCFNVQPHETVLEVARCYYLLLRRDPECAVVLSTLFASLIGKTLQSVQSTGNLSDYSELISTFYSVHSSIMKKDLKFFEAEVIPLKQMLHCATTCMSMPEVASVKHAVSFISNFLIVSRESHYLVSIANELGEGIFKQVLYYITDMNTS